MVTARQLTGIPKERRDRDRELEKYEERKRQKSGERNSDGLKKEKKMERDKYLDGG